MERRITLQSHSSGPTLGLPSSIAFLIVSFLAVSPVSFAADQAKTTAATDVKTRAEDAAKKGDTEKATKIMWDNIESLDRGGFLELIHWHEARKEWLQVIRAANLWNAKAGVAGDEEVLTALGNAQFMRGKLTEAKEALRKAIDINKKYQPAYDVLGKVYEKNPYEARVLYQDMLEVFGPKPEFLQKLCQISRSDGDNEQGEQFCKQAIAKDPNEPTAQVNLALIAKQKGDNEQARKLLKEAAVKFPSSEMAQVELGSFYEAEKNYVDAYTSFETCVKNDEKSERCLRGIGQDGVQIEKYQAAYSAFKDLCHIAGRANAIFVRRSAAIVRANKSAGEWIEKFEDLSEQCALQ